MKSMGAQAPYTETGQQVVLREKTAGDHGGRVGERSETAALMMWVRLLPVTLHIP